MTSFPPSSPLPTPSSPSRSRSTRARKPIDRLGSYAKPDDMSDEEGELMEDDDEEEEDDEWDIKSKVDDEEDDAEIEVEGDDEEEEDEEKSKSKSKNSRKKSEKPKSGSQAEKSKSSPALATTATAPRSEPKKKSSSMLPKPKTEIIKTKIQLKPSISKSTAEHIELKSVVKNTQTAPVKSKAESKIKKVDDENDEMGSEARVSDDEMEGDATEKPLNKSAASESASATSKKATKPVSSASDGEEANASEDEDVQKNVDSETEEPVDKIPDNKAEVKVGKSSRPPLVTPKAVTPSSSLSAKAPAKNKIQLAPAKPKTYGTKPVVQKAKSGFIPLVPKKVDTSVKSEPVMNKKSAPKKSTAAKKFTPEVKVEEEKGQTNQDEEEPAVESEPEEQVVAEQDEQEDRALPPTPPPTSPFAPTSSKVDTDSSTRGIPTTDKTAIEPSTPKKTTKGRKGIKTKEPSLTPPSGSDIESVASVNHSPIDEDEELPEETQLVLGSLVTDISVEHEELMHVDAGEEEVEPPEETQVPVMYRSPKSTPKKRKRTVTQDSESDSLAPATPSPSTPSKKKPAPAEKVTNHEREQIMDALLESAFIKKFNWKDIVTGEMTCTKLTRHWRESLGPALKSLFAGDKAKSSPPKNKAKGKGVVDSIWRQKMWDEVCKNCDKADWGKVVKESDSVANMSKLKRHLKESMRKDAIKWIEQ